MITVQGVAVPSKSAEAPIKTKGDSFLPLAVNVSGKKDQPKWETLRVYASDEAELEKVREVITERKSLIVKAVSDMFARTYEKDGEVRAGVSFSTNLRQVKAYDNDKKEWLNLTELLQA